MTQELLHSSDDVRFMQLALVEAKKAYEKGEVPVGVSLWLIIKSLGEDTT